MDRITGFDNRDRDGAKRAPTNGGFHMPRDNDELTGLALIAGIGAAVYVGAKVFGALRRRSAKNRAEAEANAWTEKLEEAEAQGENVCWSCRTINPKRCSRCDACMNHLTTEEYYPGLCYQCDSGD